MSYVPLLQEGLLLSFLQSAVVIIVSEYTEYHLYIFFVLHVWRDFLVALASTGKKDHPDSIHNLGVVKDWIKVVERGGYVLNWKMVEN